MPQRKLLFSYFTRYSYTGTEILLEGMTISSARIEE